MPHERSGFTPTGWVILAEALDMLVVLQLTGDSNVTISVLETHRHEGKG